MRPYLLILAAGLLPGTLLAGDLEVRPNPALVKAGGTVAFSVAADSLPEKIEWQVVPPGLGRVDASGLFTSSGRPGRGVVRALAPSQGGQAVGHAMVRVLPAGDNAIKVNVVPAAAWVGLNSSQQYTVEVRDLEGGLLEEPEISWKVVPADLGEVDASGRFTPSRAGRGRMVALVRKGLAAGMGQARVVVASGRQSTHLNVELGEARLRLEPGASVQVQATARDSAGRPVPASLKYQVRPAGLGTVSSDGVFTASSGTGHGVLTVLAEHQGAVGRARSLVVVAHEAKSYRVQLRPKSVTVAPSQSTELEPVCYDAQGKQVRPPYWRWRVVPENLGAVTPEGLFTAGDRLAQGKVVVSLPPEFGRGQDFASVRVKPGAANMVRVSPAKALLKPGQTQQFTATVTGREGRPLEVPGLVWRVFPSGLGSITPDGLFIAGQQPKIGTVVAIVPPEYGGGRGVAVVGVSNYTVLISGPRPRHLQAGEVHQFEAEIRDQAGNLVPGASWEWSASSLSSNFGRIDQATGVFTAGQPLLAQVEGNVFVKARLGGLVVGANGIHVYIHRR